MNNIPLELIDFITSIVNNEINIIRQENKETTNKLLRKIEVLNNEIKILKEGDNI